MRPWKFYDFDVCVSLRKVYRAEKFKRFPAYCAGKTLREKSEATCSRLMRVPSVFRRRTEMNPPNIGEIEILNW